MTADRWRSILLPSGCNREQGGVVLRYYIGVACPARQQFSLWSASPGKLGNRPPPQETHYTEAGGPRRLCVLEAEAGGVVVRTRSAVCHFAFRIRRRPVGSGYLNVRRGC